MAADMSALSQQMTAMAKSMEKMALDSEKSLALSQAVEKRQEAMQAQIDQQQAQLNQNTVLTAGASLQLAKQEDWVMPAEQWGLTGKEEELVSQKQCAAMIQKALAEKVAPILHAAQWSRHVLTWMPDCRGLRKRSRCPKSDVHGSRKTCSPHRLMWPSEQCSAEIGLRG